MMLLSKRRRSDCSLMITIAILLTVCVVSSVVTAEEVNYNKDDDDDDDIDYDLAIWVEMGCKDILYPRPIPSQSDWMYARKIYRDIVGEDDATIIADDDEKENNGFPVLIEPKQSSPEKGRGVFALQDINEGTLVWSISNMAKFKNGERYREFLSKFEVGLACDMIGWSYVVDTCDGELCIAITLDDSSLCNDGGEDYYDDNANVGCYEGETKVCIENDYALGDIKAGDELLCKYENFVMVVDGWEKMGFLFTDEWDELGLGYKEFGLET